jgi:hypothetical protein
VGRSIRGQFDCDGGTFDRAVVERGMFRDMSSGRPATLSTAVGSFGTFSGAGHSPGVYTDSGPPALLVRPSPAKESPRLERGVLDSDVEESEIASNVYIRPGVVWESLIFKFKNVDLPYQTFFRH